MSFPFPTSAQRTLLTLVLISSLMFTTASAVARDCAEVLDDAKEHYMFGRFEETIALLTDCVQQPDGDEAAYLEAYQYIGKAYVGLRKEQQAMDAIRELLVLVPDYEPDPADKAEYVELVHRVKLESDPDYVPPEEREEKGGGFMKKALIGAGGAAVALVLLLSGGEEETPVDNSLPRPPGLPNR